MVIDGTNIVRTGADQHQGLVEQVFDEQAGAVGRGIHQADIQTALDQILLEADFAANHYIGGCRIQPTHCGRKPSHKAIRPPMRMLA